MMMRLVAPLSIGSALAAFRYRRSEKVEDTLQAITLLNQNTNTGAAIEYLEKTNANMQLLNLNTEARLRLALRGSCLCDQVPTTSTDELSDSISMLEESIKKLVIDDEWEQTVKWLVPRMLDEDDPASYKYFLKRHRSQDMRLNHFLFHLVAKTETEYGRELINQGIITTLMGLCNYYEGKNRSIYLSALKVLANIVAQDEYCATAVVNSEWLPKLAAMVNSHVLEEMLMAEKICSNGLSVFDKNRNTLRSNIYELYRPEDGTPPLFDLVLVHGIRGSVFWTWRERDDPRKTMRTRCWPRAWLPQDVRVPMRIIAIDYLSSLVHFTGIVETMNSRAQKFTKDLKAAGIGDRPVLFICHSMGGLLVKRILLDDPDILSRTKGILFIATPHRGSPYAIYAPLGVRPSDDVKLLHQQSAINKQLHEDFLEITDAIPIISSIAETEKAPLIMRQRGVLVPPESAYLERGSFYQINDVIHHNVCKPTDQKDRIYGIILLFLNDVIHYILKSMG
ncbi:unnamed protein product [Thelazia callipaeda]|uniref:GPI inositol-deacylase n=1 Tax=Thelazia callipaeda TaxID=103827 RepID=A0A0N5CQS7_THECL|nr:unnamed protein product [Thelazia callipaeda]